jgi:hypothetical protein
MHLIDRALLFLLAALGMFAVAPLWAGSPQWTAAAVAAIAQAAP